MNTGTFLLIWVIGIIFMAGILFAYHEYEKEDAGDAEVYFVLFWPVAVPIFVIGYVGYFIGKKVFK